jgi:Short C-terminal domain
VHGRIQRRQQARWAAQDQANAAAAPAPPPPQQYAPPPQQAYAEPAPPTPATDADMGERLSQLKQLGELLSAGLLTQAEFDQQKARILTG